MENERGPTTVKQGTVIPAGNIVEMEGEEEIEEPSLVFTKSVMGQIQKEDVLAMVIAQREM